MAATYRVELINIDWRATREGSTTDAEGKSAVVQKPYPTVTLRLTVTDGGVPFVEEITVDQVWQLTGDYGDKRSVLDLNATERQAALRVWARNVKVALAAALADQQFLDRKTRILSLQIAIGSGLALSGV